MNRPLLLGTVAIIIGVGTAEYLANAISFRRWIARVVRRGELQALVGRRGIYDTDIERAWRAELFASGADPRTTETSVASERKSTLLRHLIEQEELSAAAAGQAINPVAVGREMDLLHWQFRDEKTWLEVLGNAAINLRGLRCEVATNLRDRSWIEAQIAPTIQPNEMESRRPFPRFGQRSPVKSRLRRSTIDLSLHSWSLVESGKKIWFVLNQRTLA